jgi:hypothetical protein
MLYSANEKPSGNGDRGCVMHLYNGQIPHHPQGETFLDHLIVHVPARQMQERARCSTR